MDIEIFREHCMAKKGVNESFPFDEDTMVFKVLGKIFAMASLDRQPLQVNLKCDPERAKELREEYDGIITSAYHMNKTHWNTLFVSKMPPQLVWELLGHSYDLVVAKLPKKQRLALQEIGD